MFHVLTLLLRFELARLLFDFAGLLALYLCTRNCCGVILNLFFSSAAVGCGVGLYLSGFSRSLGIMFIIVGLLMMVVIVLALIYHKLTGESILLSS